MITVAIANDLGQIDVSKLSRIVKQSFERDVMDTVTTVFTVVIIAVSIVAGMFFDYTVVPPRRSL